MVLPASRKEANAPWRIGYRTRDNGPSKMICSHYNSHYLLLHFPTAVILPSPYYCHICSSLFHSCPNILLLLLLFSLPLCTHLSHYSSNFLFLIPPTPIAVPWSNSTATLLQPKTNPLNCYKSIRDQWRICKCETLASLQQRRYSHQCHSFLVNVIHSQS